ncbi:hypothetical protein J421_1953 [Gemmatirosa kalamazoonensis]|uniref:Leucine-binding protein domain-containing protein n=2 Tax=Gemmatirosa kalamazoonensis TaxID=861299 RepID=W0RGM9_9BACT|nr:hypothetical protein J421_1953 [Gemmatirosa kalamazoonensis]
MLDFRAFLGDRPVDRRALLRLALAIPFARVLAPRRVRVVLVGAPDPSLADALAFGVDEATRSAQPFGVAVALERAADAAAVTAARDTALVLFGGDDAADCRAVAARARTLGAVYVDAWCGLDAWTRRADGCARAIVHVAPSDAMRVDALGAGAPEALRARRWLVTTADASDAQMLLAVRGARALGAAGATVVGLVGQTRTDGAAHDALLHVGTTIEARLADDARPLRAVGWHASLEPYGGAQLGDRFRGAVHRPMDERAWAAWAGVKLVVEAALRAGAAESIAQRLARADFIFDAHKGVPLFVRAEDRQLVQPLYLVRAGDDGADTVVATAPRVGGGDPRARLAALGREPHACGAGA